MADCPRCTSDLERQTDWRWTCPAWGLKVDIATVVTSDPDTSQARELRDAWSEVAELMVDLNRDYPQLQGLFARVYRTAGEMAEKYDDMAGGK